jgi:hypothetical protein
MSNDQGVPQAAVEAAATWLREAEQAHPGPMGSPYAQLQPPQRKEPYRKRARSLLAFVRPALEEEMRQRVRAIPKEDGIAAGFLRRRTVEAALASLSPSEDTTEGGDRADSRVGKSPQSESADVDGGASDEGSGAPLPESEPIGCGGSGEVEPTDDTLAANGEMERCGGCSECQPAEGLLGEIREEVGYDEAYTALDHEGDQLEALCAYRDALEERLLLALTKAQPLPEGEKCENVNGDHPCEQVKWHRGKCGGRADDGSFLWWEPHESTGKKPLPEAPGCGGLTKEEIGKLCWAADAWTAMPITVKGRATEEIREIITRFNTAPEPESVDGEKRRQELLGWVKRKEGALQSEMAQTARDSAAWNSLHDRIKLLQEFLALDAALVSGRIILAPDTQDSDRGLEELADWLKRQVESTNRRRKEPGASGDARYLGGIEGAYEYVLKRVDYLNASRSTDAEGKKP